MADVNFLRFSFFSNTSLGYYKSGHVGEGLATAFIHTCSGRAQKIPFSMATLDPRGGKTSFLRRRTHWSPGCEEFLVAGWPAGWLAGWQAPHLRLSASGLLVHNAQTKRHFSPSRGMNGAGSKAECLEALIHLPAVGLYARPWTLQFVWPQSCLVHWGKWLWWWRKSREAYFYRKTVPLRVQHCCFGGKERNTEEPGLLGGKNLLRGESLKSNHYRIRVAAVLLQASLNA